MAEQVLSGESCAEKAGHGQVVDRESRRRPNSENSLLLRLLGLDTEELAASVWRQLSF